jgi:Fe-S-cluster containining protein
MPLVLEDFVEVYEFFPIVFGVLDGDIRAFILLSDGESACPYLGKNGCEIYEYRPPGCRIYPFSPFFDSIMLDDSCKALGSGDIVAKDGLIDSSFYHKRLEGLEIKFTNALAYYQTLKYSLVEYKKVQDFMLYRYDGEPTDEYISMHLKSLELYESKGN